MSHDITSHKVNPLNDKLVVRATDDPGPGGANHRYVVYGPPSTMADLYINFQNGGIAEAGINGVTHEVLIAIVLDRLHAFQKGVFACRENALAITKLEEAQHWLFHRTLERTQRGVEGTLAK